MAQPYENRPIDDAVELLRVNGFDGLAEAVTVLLNSAMLAERSDYLGAAPYERSAHRVGYANGYKDKQLKTRLGTLPLKVPQTRDGEFYPQSLEKGLRSERALLLAIAEMYVQGVSTRRVKRIVEELCGLEVSSSQVSRAAAELDAMLEAAGELLASRVGGEIDEARQIAAEAGSAPRVVYLYSRGPSLLFLFGEGIPTNAMIEGAGAFDAGAEIGEGAIPLTPEALVAAAPDVIVLPESGVEGLGGFDAILEIPGVAETPAGSNGALLAYDEAYFFNLGPRTGLALNEFVEDLYALVGW